MNESFFRVISFFLIKQNSNVTCYFPNTSTAHENVDHNTKRSGYYGNLGSLKAGTRHHGDYSVMGNSFPPTFPEDLLAHASQ